MNRQTTFHIPSQAFILSLVFALVLCSCGRDRPDNENPTPIPTPTTSIPFNLLDTELLGASGISAACEHPPEAQMNCTHEQMGPLLEVDLNASTYARWYLKFGETAESLSGTETLYLHARRQGDVSPNLYLVEPNGERIPINLARFGLGEDWSHIYIPLLEIKDDEGNSPDFAQISAIQIVFEWADMVGALEFDSLRFDSVWRESVAISEETTALAEELSVPDGFVVHPVAENLRSMTQIDYTTEGSMLVSLQNGRIWWYSDLDGDGRYDERHLYTTGLPEVVGLLYDPADGAVWLGGRGQLYRTWDSDQNGVADVQELRIDGLPWGRHQNNGLVWNPDPDPFTGEPGGYWIYFGLGSTGDLDNGGDINSTILRFPRDGQGKEAVEIVSQGNRNAYMVVWAPVTTDPNDETTWQLFASENGPDFNDAPDEVNHIRWQHHYGFPEQFGPVEPESADGDPYSGPLYPVTAHASASGLAYINNPDWPVEYRTLYVALFGQIFGTEIAGHRVDRIALSPVTTATGATYRGERSDFIVGLDRPLPLATDPNGDLIVGDYATGVIYRVSYSEQAPYPD